TTKTNKQRFPLYNFTQKKFKLKPKSHQKKKKQKKVKSTFKRGDFHNSRPTNNKGGGGFFKNFKH
ncbi:hypothetical protein MNBD_GAMMA03-1439, partial [hydrothermal vent metagenome]